MTNSISVKAYPRRRPEYCTFCGSRLSIIDNRPTRYDAYTGEEVKDGNYILSCPKWSETYPDRQDHDRMEWNDNAAMSPLEPWRPLHPPFSSDGSHYRLADAVSPYRLEPLVIRGD